MEQSDVLLEQIAEEFLQRSRNGERPSIEEYIARFPDLGDQIRGTLQTVSVIEKLKFELPNGSQPSAAWASELPPRIGEYEILSEIGRGGMGVVYRARQESLGRWVALKVMTKGAMDPVSLMRFQREARAAAKLHHSNIVPIFQVDQDDGRAFYAMQLIEGCNLDQIVDALRHLRDEPGGERARNRGTDHRRTTTSPSPPPDDPHSLRLARALIEGALIVDFYRSIASIGQQAAEALAYAHSRGIVHRDIKPSNLILDQAGVVWVGDFGLAKEDDEGLTQTGDFVGTIRYMSPERFRGECDPRTDIYALGLSLYELIALKPAYDSPDRIQLVNLMATTNPTMLRAIDTQTPVDLETIVLKAMERDPRSRYASARDMADDLRRFIEDRPIKARPLSPAERTLRWCRRNRTLAALLAVVASLMLLLAIGLPIALIREISLRRQATAAEHLAEERRGLANRNLYVAEMNLAGQSANEPGGVYRVRELTSKWRPEIVGEDLRGWEWYFLQSMCDREHVKVELKTRITSCCWNPDSSRLAICGPNGWVQIRSAASGEEITTLDLGSKSRLNEVRWSADGERLAAAGTDGIARVWNVATGEMIQSLDHGARVFSVSWSPLGDELATAGEDCAVRFWDADSGDEIQAFTNHRRPVHTVDWHPDGTRLASGSWAGTVQISSTKGKEPVTLWDQDRTVYCVRWSPDGTRLACGFADGATRVFDVSNGKRLWTSTVSSRINHIAWRPDGTCLALVSDDRAIRIHSAVSGALVRRFDGHSDRISAVDWSRDGKWLASVGFDGTMRVWDAGMTMASVVLAELRHSIDAAAWSPDGRYIAANCLDLIHLVDARNGTLVKTLKGHQGGIRLIAWHPSGARLASASRDGTAIVWEVASGEVLLHFREHTAIVHAVAWSPDGKWLASASHDRTVKVWDATSGALATDFKEHRNIVDAVDWHPEGGLLASTDHDGRLLIWEPSTGHIVHALQGDTGIVRAVRWSPNGSLIALGGQSGIVRLWDMSLGTHVASLTGHTGNVISITWSPDGSRLASCAERRDVRIWDVATATEILRIQEPLDLVRAVDWNHDGRRLFAADARGAITLFDASAGLERARAQGATPAAAGP